MKILLFNENASLSRYWLDAVLLLNSRGINASLATLRESGPLSQSLKQHRIQVFSLGAKRVVDYPRSAKRLAAIVRKHSFQMVHASEPIPAAISCAAAWLGAPHLRLFHRHHVVCPKSTRSFNSVTNWFSEAMMACSESVKAAAVNEGFAAHKIYVAHNGITALRKVDNAEIYQLKSRLGIPQRAITICQVGRLSEEKGQRTLVEAAAIIAADMPEPLHLVFVGDGPLEAYIREASRQIPNLQTHLIGHQDDVAPWFALADVNAVPSYTEAFGISAVEAMSSGRPVVASGVEGLMEVVEDGVSGLLVRSRNPGELAAAMLKIIKSPDLAHKLGCGGVTRVKENFTMDKMVDGWIGCYNWALQTGR